MITISLWKLLSDNKIQIPLYQRDYAQGRSSDSVKFIREAFIHDLFEALSPGNPPLDLGLVFGSENKGAFIPVDGQQRLTTVFLVYWLVAFRERKLKDHQNVFSNFSYQTRQSSSDFFRFLANFHDGYDTRQQNDIIDKIKDNPSFFSVWENDPTVSGALKTIEEIDDRITKNSDTGGLWNKLTSESCPITFSRVSLDEYKLTDQLYIRMNARGKQLTDFENFKAWLSGLIMKNEWHLDIDWETKLDTTWLDLFWKSKDKDDYLVDQEYMRFFNGMAQIAVALSTVEKKELKDNIQRFVSTKDNEELYIPLALYEELGCFNEENVKTCFQVLDRVSDYGFESLNQEKFDINFKWFSDEESVFSSFITGQITFEDRVRFYAMAQYLLKHPEEKKETVTENFRDWTRVIRNLLSNTVISAENMGDILNSISDLIEKIKEHSILEVLSKDIDIKAFSQVQIAEERQKAKLILGNTQWRETLKEAENHSLFQGCISFLLLPDDNNDTYEDFRKRWVTVNQLFDQDGSGASEKLGLDKNYLLMRAMIANLDKAFVWNESIVFKDDKSSWRELLKKDEVKNAMRKVIDRCSDSPQSIVQSLETICQDCPDTPLWRQRLVKYPKLLSDPGVSKLKKVKKFYNGRIFLYNSSSIPGAIEIETYRNRLITALLNDSDLSLKLDNVERNRVADIFYRNEPIILKSDNSNLILTFSQYHVKLNEKDINAASQVYPPENEKAVDICVEIINQEVQGKTLSE